MIQMVIKLALVQLNAVLSLGVERAAQVVPIKKVVIDNHKAPIKNRAIQLGFVIHAILFFNECTFNHVVT